MQSNIMEEAIVIQSNSMEEEIVI